jgi:hypothetical protein
MLSSTAKRRAEGSQAEIDGGRAKSLFAILAVKPKCATVPVTKPGGGQSFDSSMLVAEAKFLPDPGEVVAAYRIIPPLPCGLILQDL